MNLPFELFVAAPLPPRPAEAGVHLGDFADLRDRRCGRRHGAADRAGADDRSAERAARSAHRRRGARLRVRRPAGSLTSTKRSRSCAGAARQSAPRRRCSASVWQVPAVAVSPSRSRAIDPALEKTVSTIARSMVKGSFDDLHPAQGDGLPSIILGKELAEKLGVTVGDSIEVLHHRRAPDAVRDDAQAARAARRWHLQPRTVRVRLDRTAGRLARGRAPARPSAPRLHRGARRRPVLCRGCRRDIPRRLGPEYQAQDWLEKNKSLFNALWLEKMAMAITIGLIVMVAALNIIASLIMLVMEKTRDIAILKTMGSVDGEHPAHLRAAGPDHRRRRDGLGRASGNVADLRARSLQADSHRASTSTRSPTCRSGCSSSTSWWWLSSRC